MAWNLNRKTIPCCGPCVVSPLFLKPDQKESVPDVLFIHEQALGLPALERLQREHKGNSIGPAVCGSRSSNQGGGGFTGSNPTQAAPSGSQIIIHISKQIFWHAYMFICMSVYVKHVYTNVQYANLLWCLTPRAWGASSSELNVKSFTIGSDPEFEIAHPKPL